MASLFFYASWQPKYLLLIATSIIVNYVISKFIARSKRAKLYLIVGISFNVLLLSYFKYTDFLIVNISYVFGVSEPPLINVVLPIGISFFTFQQIAFLVDTYKSSIMTYNFINYSLFVSFFPQLVSGPIVHHKEMMPQFEILKEKKINWESIYTGLFLIGFGLFKKIAIADTFAIWVNEGFNNVAEIGFWSAWKTSLSYTVQLYFDFSGYMDIAIGSAKLFNINLPWNFNSPYLAVNIQDFWRRWHMTLGRFLRDYIYKILGGNRMGLGRTCGNLFLTFLIGGIWHGAGWTFVFWGSLHGTAMVIHRLWQMTGMRIPKAAAWLITFLFVNAAWVYFRAPDFQTANALLLKMIALNTEATNLAIEFFLHGEFHSLSPFLPILLIFILLELFYKNSHQWAEICRPCLSYTLSTIFSLILCTWLLMNQNRYSEFIYFQF
jgi:D-alanyl-lipoteichoic acid acyltransferase DltB (MBOAT superfamily)